MQVIAQQLGALLVGAIPTTLLFIVLVMAYQFLVQGPLTATLKKRRALTEGAMEDAQNAIAQAETRTAEYATKLRQARAEVYKVREQRMKQWNAERDAALDVARKAYGLKVSQAKAELEAEAAAAKQTILGTAGDLAGQVAGRAQDGLFCGCGFGFKLGLGLAHLQPVSLAGDVQGGVTLRVPLLHALLANLVDLGTCLAKLGRILCRPGFGLRDCILSVFHGAFGKGAALFQRCRQRSLNQKLVGHNQHDEQQSGRYGADQQGSELLGNYLHGGKGSLRPSDEILMDGTQLL